MSILPKPTCSVEGCERPATARGYCKGCWQRERRAGRLKLLPKLSLQERFWKRVGISPRNQCWPWQGGASSEGYGHVSIDGAMKKATHLSWFVHHGEWPSDLGMMMLHKCDNPICVNPAHLFLGTNADNSRDRSRKGRGRHPVGSDHGKAKLTEQDVRAIRQLYATTSATYTTLGNRFGVNKTTIMQIVRRRTWKHV